MLAADNWCVKVDERIYGPYTSQQLRKFAHEGRLAAWSLVAPAGSRSWREARNETTLASFFGFEAAAAAASAGRAFGKRDLEPEEEATPPAGKPAARKTGSETKTGKMAAARRDEPAVEPGRSNFVLIFDVVSAAASRVETAVLSLGPGFRIADNVWTVCCELTAIGVRNAIAPYLLPRESILVVDATKGRTSWQNFPPEVHAKLAAAWAQTR